MGRTRRNLNNLDFTYREEGDPLRESMDKKQRKAKIEGQRGGKAPKSNARPIRRYPSPKRQSKRRLMRADGSCTSIRPKRKKETKY